MWLGLFIYFRTDYSRLHATSAAKVEALGVTFDVKCSRNVRDFKKRFRRKAERCVRPSHLSDLIFIWCFLQAGISTKSTHSSTFLLQMITRS